MHGTHVTALYLENFKQFEKLKVENIGQFNILTGDNNSGKTSVLEALLAEPRWDPFEYKLRYVLENFKRFTGVRQHFLHQYINKDSEKSFFSIGIEFKHGQSTFKLKVEEKNGFKEHYTHSKDSNYYNPHASDLNFIPFYLGYNHNITHTYLTYVNKYQDKDDKLIESASIILPDIRDIKPDMLTCDDAILLIGRRGKNVRMPLGTYGDGFINTFRLLIEIVRFSEHRIMVDEIDSGIYYERMKNFWKAVLNACMLNKVQLFASTHNKECIKHYQEALEELGKEYQDDARIINLYQHKDGSIRAYTSDYQNFTSNLETETELR